MADVLPRKAHWIQDRVVEFQPQDNYLTTSSGLQVDYEYLVVAVGLQLDWHKVEGLQRALDTDQRVCSNYSPRYVNKTLEALRRFKRGNAIFTFPETPIKCAGAPQKVMYIAEEYLRQHGKRKDAQIVFNTSLGVLFGVKKYADALWKVVEQRGIDVNLGHQLVEVLPESGQAVFQLTADGSRRTFDYEMLHVTPPMSPPDVLGAQLTNAAGYLDLDRKTLQHVRYANLFGLGDCTSLPTSKTAAAVAVQNRVVFDNLSRVMHGQELKTSYDGYTSCPLVTGYSKCILAEFDYDGRPVETLPIDQARERSTTFHLKKDVMPSIYWNLMLKGHWSGPATIRKVLHLGRNSG